MRAVHGFDMTAPFRAGHDPSWHGDLDRRAAAALVYGSSTTPAATLGARKNSFSTLGGYC